MCCPLKAGGFGGDSPENGKGMHNSKVSCVSVLQPMNQWHCAPNFNDGQTRSAESLLASADADALQTSETTD